MLNNREVLKKFEEIMLSISDKADTFENYRTSGLIHYIDQSL